MALGALGAMLLLERLSRPSEGEIEWKVRVPPTAQPEDLDRRLRALERGWWEEEGLVPPPV